MGRSSFSSAERIRKTADFQFVYKKGERVITKYFVWFFLDAKDSDSPRRLGITVTRDVGNAVQRNRIKRQIREFFRANKDAFPRGDLIIKARMGAGGAENTQLKRDLESGMSRLIKYGRGGL